MRLVCALYFSAPLAVLAADSSAESASATGTIQGRVLSAVIQECLRNVEVIIPGNITYNDHFGAVWTAGIRGRF